MAPGPLDPLRNQKDPLHKSGPDQAKELFRKITAVASGFSTDDVLGAATNLVINALRQAHATRNAAEAAYDERSGRAKQLLLDHYDGVTGKRRNIFPHDQVIAMSHFNDRDRTGGGKN